MMMQSANGLGLQAFSKGDYCQVTMKFPSDTIPKWVSFSRVWYKEPVWVEEEK